MESPAVPYLYTKSLRTDRQMSKTRRKKYISRREQNKLAAKRAKMVVVVAALALLVYLIYRRVSIYDYLATYFY